MSAPVRETQHDEIQRTIPFNKHGGACTTGTMAAEDDDPLEKSIQDWVQAQAQFTDDMSKEQLTKLQKKAQQLILKKQQTIKACAERGRVKRSLTSDPEVPSALKKGIEHLKKLGLVPDNLPDIDEANDEDILLQDIVNQATAGNKKHILNSSRTGNENECTCSKVGVKSGKYSKNNVNIVKQEQWPHNAVLRKYVKRTTFNSMKFDMFVAGETNIILHMFSNNEEAAIGRLRVLSLVSHWLCKSKNWWLVKGLYEGIIEEVETGVRTWSDDFTSYKTMLPPNMMGKPIVNNGGTHSGEKVKPIEVYWCKKISVRKL